METEISTKNTKNEILAAYEELLAKVQNQKSDQPKLIQEETRKKEVIAKASENSVEGIVNGIASLKLGLAKELDKLSEQLIAEYKKLADIQSAIQLEKKNLEDLYEVTANADSLAAMLLAQKEKKVVFETEMAQRKADLEEKLKTDKALFDEKMAVEKENFESAMKAKKELWQTDQQKWTEQQKELKETTEKQRKREEEEYLYNLKLTRKKETDTYEEKKARLEKELADKKAAFEKEISEREAKLVAAEAELNELRKKAETFPKDLEKAVAAAEKAVTEKLTTKYDFEKQLTARQTEGEIKLKEQTINTLQAKIKDLETFNKELSGKANVAEANVKDIAIKAIENSRKLQIIDKTRENQEKD
jgi:hypothetical protein